MEVLKKYHSALLKELETAVEAREPKELYDPIRYILSLGGKRVRPALTLMACDFLSGDFHKALPAAMAVELFHNFSLIHDDIMDAAPLRRGKASVHEKWDVNTGILSGDAMLILAYRFFEHYEPETFKALAQLFSETALQVCEGQQLDMDFEKRNDVVLEEYLKMISQKTAVLLGAAMEMGAIIAGTTKEERQLMYEFGKNLGIAFQLQDDYLDVFGDPEKLGKQKGGDIIANKKTILYITALKYASEKDQDALQNMYDLTPDNPESKIELVMAIFSKAGAAEKTKKEIQYYSEKAFALLNVMSISEDRKTLFRDFGLDLMERDL